MKSGSDVAERATDEMSNRASHPDLKAALDQVIASRKKGRSDRPSDGTDRPRLARG